MHVEFSNVNKNKPTKYSFITKTIVMTLAVLIASYIMDGVKVDNVFVAILAAVVISLLNNFIRPILIVLTLPFTILSMGLFLLVINALIIIMASKIVPDFYVDGFATALIFSLMITLLNYLLDILSKMVNKKKYDENNTFSHNADNGNEHFDDYEDVTDQDEDGSESKNDENNNLLNR